MKKLLILILICFAQNIFSQTATQESENKTYINDDNNVYNTAGIEVQPNFPGGLDKFYTYVDKNLKAPKEKPDLKGKIYATFIIEKDGSLSDIKIIKDLGLLTQYNAIDVLKKSPKWISGKNNGKDVRTMYSVVLNLK